MESSLAGSRAAARPTTRSDRSGSPRAPRPRDRGM